MQELCRSLLTPSHKSDYASSFQFLHFEGWNEELVQLLGAVMNLDLDTILDIVPENTSIETTSFDSYVHLTLPWIFLDRTLLKRSILHVLLFTKNNISNIINNSLHSHFYSGTDSERDNWFIEG